MLDQKIDPARFKTIMELIGADELKETVKHMDIFLNNKKSFATRNIKMPNFLWAVKRGGGLTTMLNAFTEYLYSIKAIEFSGTVKCIEFNLDYIAPAEFFLELSRLDKTIADFAGYTPCYKGIICIDIDNWIERLEEDHFTKLLNYVASNNDKLLVIFCIHTDRKNVLEAVDSFLSSYLRIQSLTLRFPNADELVKLLASWYKQECFSFTKKAKVLLRETIVELAAEKNFNGFKTIAQLAHDILWQIMTSESSNDKNISAEMLLRFGYGKDSTYVKRAKTRLNTIRTIGFVGRTI
jgi:hypothetical protein